MGVWLVIAVYAAVIWLALMGLGYLRPRVSSAAPRERGRDVDPRSPHTIFEEALSLGGGAPDGGLPPMVRERAFQSALAVAARKPEMLFAIGHVIGELGPSTAEEVDAIVETTVASVEAAALDAGAAAAGAWHPIRVRAFLEGLAGETRLFFYLPASWDGPWRFLACANSGRRRRRPKVTDLSLTLFGIDPAAFDRTRALASRGEHNVGAIVEGREHIVDRIHLRVECDAEQAVEGRDRLAVVAAGLAAGLLGEQLPEATVFAIRRGHELGHTMSAADLAYRHRIDRPYRTEGERCLAEVVFTRRSA